MTSEIPREEKYYPVPNSSTAVISLIAGILGLTFFPLLGSIIAIITGMMAQKEIRESEGTVGGEGLATAGMIMGWIGIGLAVLGFCIFGVLVSIPFCIMLNEGNFLLAPAVFNWLF
jgi:hypothetical protein